MLRAFGVLVAALIGLTVSTGAYAQSQPVYQSGLVTPRHVLAWATNGVAEDPEQVSIGGLSQLTLTNTGTPFCINDALTTAVGGYHQFCIGANSLGGGLISYQAYGGASPLSLQCNINGTILPCFPSGGNVTAATSPAPVAGNAAKWGGGTVLLDAGLPPAYQVDTIAALKATPLTLLANGVITQVNGYWAKAQAPPDFYLLSTSACSLNGGTGDGGSQIPSATSGNCWLKVRNQAGAENLLNWGASGSSLTTTGTTTGSSTSPNITLAAAGDFLNGEPIAIAGAGAASTASSPGGISVTSNNATGSPTQYCYRVAAVDAAGAVSTASTEVCASDGGAQLGTVADLNATPEYEQIQWSAATNAISYLIYGWTTGSEVFIGKTSDLSWNDFGFKSGGSGWNNHQTPPNWVSTAPLSQSQPGFWHTNILSGAGTTSLVATGNAPTAVIGGVVTHDDTSALTNVLASGSDVYFPGGTYPFFGFESSLTNGQSLMGCGAECSMLQNYVQGGLIIGNGGATVSGVYTRDFGMDGANGLFGDAVYLNNATQGRIANLEFDNYYTNMQIANGSGTYYINEIQTKNGLAGDYGIYITGNDAATTQVIYFDGIRQYGAGKSTTAKLMWIDGTVDTIHVSQAQFTSSSQAGYRIANDVGATHGPNGIFFKNPGCNGQETYCFNVQNVHHLEISDIFGQMTKGSANPAIFIGPNAYQVWINGIGRIFGTSTWGVQFQGHGLYISDQSIYGNDTGSIFCDGGENMTINGGDSLGLNATTPSQMTTTGNIGIKLGSTCGGPISISGNWKGLVTDIEDDASPAAEVHIQGMPDGSLTGLTVNTTGNQTMTIASFSTLYNGLNGTIATLDAGGFTGTPTYTTNSATNILTQISTSLGLGGTGNVPVGTTINFVIKNHANAHAITVAGGSGVTITGQSSVPANGGTGTESYRRFRGVVTNAGSPAITFSGCSLTAGSIC